MEDFRHFLKLENDLSENEMPVVFISICYTKTHTKSGLLLNEVHIQVHFANWKLSLES